MKSPSFPDVSVFLCNGSKCGKHKEFRRHLKNELKELAFTDVEVFQMECTDRCKFAPILCLQPHNIWFYQGNEHTVKHIIETINHPSSST